MSTYANDVTLGGVQWFDKFCDENSSAFLLKMWHGGKR